MRQPVYDVAIIGGGPGGYSAALRAGTANMKTALVEKDKVGGLCLHKGCIPSKALLTSAKKMLEMRSSSDFGVNCQNISFDWNTIIERKQRVVQGLYKGLQMLLRQRYTDIYMGEAAINRKNNIFSVEISENGQGKIIEARKIIIATGSREKTPENFNVDRENIVTSDEALSLDAVPETMLVVGGGSIGIEFATLLNAFGTKVTVVEAASHILPFADETAARELEKALTKKGINFQKKVAVQNISTKNGRVSASILSDSEEFKVTADKCLVAIGRSPNLPDMDFKLETDGKGYVLVNELMRTSQSGIYAIGDVINTPALAHVAFNEGIVAVEDILNLKPLPIDYLGTPWCVYSEPQLAYAGITEQAAVEQGMNIDTKTAYLTGNAMAMIEGETDGLVKIITDEAGIVLGVHMVGPNVTEIIAEAMLSISWGADVYDIARLIHPHPTLSEGISEASLFLTGKPLHMPQAPIERRKAA